MKFIATIVFVTSFSFGFSQKTIHVFVALCDNKNQGIVPVSAKLGNGQDPYNNLYWGAMYGVKSFFKRSPEWQLMKTVKNPQAAILERCIFKHAKEDVWLIADAYDGKEIKKATWGFLRTTAGYNPFLVHVDRKEIKAGSHAQLIAYVGHDGLMDFSIDNYPKPKDNKKRDAIILACISKPYFKDAVKSIGAKPLLWTTGLMAPEAYTLKAAINGWISSESDEQIRQRAAEAYHKYQKCGVSAAKRLLVTGW
ncbi:MAG: hypothetical protein COA57_16575 [Flavobacteriales bacterium]|nr:MAG: hypothetical protein COA57_16575 [Flavobacteriales bacterium]